jgi:hypothetical protein
VAGRPTTPLMELAFMLDWIPRGAATGDAGLLRLI